MLSAEEKTVSPRVLILSVTAGDGHARAAKAIEKALLVQMPEAEVTILDTFKHTSPLLEKMVLGTYLEIIKISPMLYGYLYQKAEKRQPFSGIAKTEFNKILKKIAAPKLVSLIKSFNPQLIICTHPFPLGIVSSLKQAGGISASIIGVITDFTVHSYWLYPQVDYYCIASSELKPLFAEYGYQHAKVYPTGIPIDPVFRRVENKTKLRDKLKVAPHLPTILVCGGGNGIGPLEEVVKVLSEETKDCQLLVVCGRNKALKEKLDKISVQANGRVKVYGFINNIHELMGAADLMVSKAGGLTCSEAAAMGLPLFIVDPIPGQEERNTEFLVRRGAAVRIRNEKHLLAELDNCLRHPEIIIKMAEAVKRIGCPDSSHRIASLMEEIIAG